MPRGYYGDCRDCCFYNSYFHKVNNDKYEYKCDQCNEYFNNSYGETCHLFEDIADIEEEKRNNQKRKEAIVAGIGLVCEILGGNEEEDDCNDASINQNTYNSQQDFPWDALLYVLLGSVPMIIFGWIFIIKPIIYILFS